MKREDLNWKGVVIAQKAIRTMYLLCMLFKLKAPKQPEELSFVINTYNLPESLVGIRGLLRLNYVFSWDEPTELVAKDRDHRKDVVSSSLSVRKREQSVLILAPVWHNATASQSGKHV